MTADLVDRFESTATWTATPELADTDQAQPPAVDAHRTDAAQYVAPLWTRPLATSRSRTLTAAERDLPEWARPLLTHKSRVRDDDE